MRGFVEDIRPGAVRGWAWDAASNGPTKVRVLRSNKVIASGETTLDRNDVARSLGEKDALRSGFIVPVTFDQKDVGKLVVQASKDGQKWDKLPNVKKPAAVGQSYQDFMARELPNLSRN